MLFLFNKPSSHNRGNFINFIQTGTISYLSLNKISLDNEPGLLEQFYAGSHEAFTVLYREYSERLYNNHIGTEELVREILAHIWSKWDSIRIQTHIIICIPAAQQGQKFHPWVLAVRKKWQQH